MFYYMYQITNKLNGKIYVGVHKTKSLDDGYMGSGKVIRCAIAKYGIENFEKVIHETFDNAEAMYAKEKEVVNEEFLSRDDVYNIRRGGHGGFEYINKTRNHFEHNRLISANRNHQDADYVKLQSDKMKLAHKEGRTFTRNPFNGKEFLGRLHTEESKKKIGVANSKMIGSENSQYGTTWITNGVENKKIKKIDTIPEGFSRGRKF